MRNRILKTGIKTGLLQVVQQIVVIATGIVLARQLGPESYGVYTFAMAIVTMLMLLAQLGFPSYTIREVSVYRSKTDWLGLSSYMRYSFFFVACVSTLIAIASYIIILFLRKNEIVELHRLNTIALALLLIPASVPFRIVMSYLKGFQEVALSQLIVTFRAVLFLIICVAFMYFEIGLFSAENILLIQFVTALVFLAISLLALKKMLPTEVAMGTPYASNKYWLSGAVSFTMLSALQYLNSYVDILMIGIIRTDVEVAIYRVASQGSTLTSFGTQIAVMTLGPEIARMFASNNLKKLQQIMFLSSKFIFLLAVTTTTVVFLFAEEIIDLLFGAAYLNSQTALVILCFGKAVGASVGCGALVLTMCGYQNKASLLLLITATANVILNAILVPLYGATGAATATSVVTIISAVFIYQAVKKNLGLNSFAFGRV